ncbi:cation-translocating P-type ATPase [Chloroflexota bacterium]
MDKWYQLSSSEVIKQLDSSRDGLTSPVASARLATHGYNELKFKKRSALVRFLLQFHNSLVYVLLGSALITLTLGMWTDTSVILLVVILNTIIGFIQEGKAESSIEALQKMMAPNCTVLRDNREKVIPARELVIGDVVLLEGGDGIPADLRIFGAKNLKLDEAALTGESVPVSKDTGSRNRPNLPPGEQTCMAFSGTFVTQGRGVGIVVTTGGETEFGKIAKLMNETPKTITPLMRKINDFTRMLIFVIIGLAVINFGLAIFFDYDIVYSFLSSVSLAVAAIPEMLPAIVTIILALAATIMSRRNALIRRLPAAETLGCATVICSDKTGTLTMNQMTVVRVYAGGRDYTVRGAGYESEGEFLLDGEGISTPDHTELLETLRAGYLCNNARLTKEDGAPTQVIGDPTEGALIVSAAKADITDNPVRLDEIPFESEFMYMSTLHQGEMAGVIYVKGSPEKVLGMCETQFVGDTIRSLDEQGIRMIADEFAGGALRVLGMAFKTVTSDVTSLDLTDLTGLTFLGLQGMIDPPREEVITAIKQCKMAGIRTVMITGDHAKTASAIAKQLGIVGSGNEVLTGEQLSAMDDDELYAEVEKVSVYARVAPEHKLRVTKQLQKHGNVAVVTGDGVNDAPALKAADLGVAMGLSGTQVSKEAADMVLADDNFASIVSAVEEGRNVWKNLEKAILYTLPTNGGQALLVMGAVMLAPFIALFALRLPLEPIQILWVNLFDSVFLTVPLIMEPKDKNLLENPPRDPKARIANRLFFERVGLVSFVMALTGFAVYYYYGAPALSGSVVDEVLLTQAQTAAFVSIIMVHLGFVVTARSIYGSAFTFNPFSNKWLLIGMATTVITGLMIVYIPFLNIMFRTAPFPAEWWSILVLAFIPGFFSVELEKLARKLLRRM